MKKLDDVIQKLRGRVKRIAIMGGTFDPIHYGHLVAAEAVRIRFGLDRVIFIPTGNPPHKKKIKVTPAEHRYVMAQMAVNSNPYFDVSRIEMDREGYTYTVDTIKQIQQILGCSTEVYFITGADAMLEILTWKNVDELLRLCKFVAVTRPGYRVEDLDYMRNELKVKFNCEVVVIDVPSYAISSTDIRRRIADGYSIKYLVPEDVEKYIIKNGLYTAK